MSEAVLEWPAPPFVATETDRRLWRVQPDLTVRQWAERHLRITDGPLIEKGAASLPWSADVFPLQNAIIDAISDKRWGRVLLLTAPQAFGKTECAMLPAVLHAVAHRRVNVMYVAGSRELAESQWLKKFRPAIKAAPELSELVPEETNAGGTKTRRDFTNGTSLHMCGAESIAALSGHTAPVICLDDVQSYPVRLPRFGHPADYAPSRAGSFPPEYTTIVLAGTASDPDDWLWRSLAASTFYCPFVPCLRCAAYQLLAFHRLRDGVFPCCKCGEPMGFVDLRTMLERHLWVSAPPDVDWVADLSPEGVVIDPAESAVYPHTARNTNVAGFWCNAFYWPLGASWEQRAAEHASISGDPDKLVTWQLNVEARPYRAAEADEDALTEAEVTDRVVDGYEAGTIPAAADLVTEAVDVQSGYVYWLVRAWCRATGESWLVDLGTYGRPMKREDVSDKEHRARRAAGITAGLNEVYAAAARGWPRAESGEVVKLDSGVVDRGYEKDIVGAWWSAKHGGIWHLVWGATADVGKVRERGEIWPLKPRLDGRVPYRRVDVNQAKHLHRKLMRVPADQPGAWHMPATGLHTNTLRAYARHLTSERFDAVKKRWEPLRPGMANHWYDCEIIGLCLAKGRGVKFTGFEVAAAPVAQPSVAEALAAFAKRRRDW